MTSLHPTRALWTSAAILASCLLTATCATVPAAYLAPSYEGQPPTFRLPSDARPLAYTLDLEVDPREESFRGKAQIRVALDSARRTLWLHGRRLEVTRARIAGQPAQWSEVGEDGIAALTVDTPVGPGEVDVEVEWSARFHPALESVYRTSVQGDWYAFTQFEAVAAREAFPCFDEPGFKTPWALSITTSGRDLAVANTLETAREDFADGRRRYRFAPSKPMPSYLVAFAVGPIEVIESAPLPATPVRPTAVPLRGISVRGQSARLATSLEVTRAGALALERWFGIAYPYDKLDIVAVPDFEAGAMENVGLVTFRDSRLFVDSSSSLMQQKASVGTIVHELAHQWFGNLVTMAWWDDLWLNEAFASWLPVEILEELRPDLHAHTAARADLDGVTRIDSLTSARQIRQPVETTGDILNAFDGITYDKGAAVIGMFADHVGAQAFRDGVRAYLRAHAYGNATTEDLLDSVSRTAGRDIRAAFMTFLDQPGVPLIKADMRCTPGARPVVTLTQERFLPLGSAGNPSALWHVPVCIRSEDDSETHRTCTLLTERTGIIDLPNRACPKTLHPNVDGGGYYRWMLPPDALRALGDASATLTPGERISFANALGGAEESGSLPFGDVLAAAVPLATDETAEVAAAPLGLFAFATRELLEGDARTRAQMRCREVYRPVLQRVGLTPRAGESAPQRDLRTLATTALVQVCDDAETTHALADLMGDLGAAGQPLLKVDAADDIVSHALKARVRLEGAPAWERLRTRLATESDGTTRRRILAALSDVDEPALARRALDLALDPMLRINEVTLPLARHASEPRVRATLWSWMMQNYDALARRLPADWADAAIVSSMMGYCTDDMARSVEAFFQRLPKPSSALPRALAQTVEAIRLCAARRAAHQPSAQQTFRSELLR